MDNFKILTENLIKANGSFVNDLICQPSTEQMQMLKEGSGNPDSEMRQVNSSAGLGINFWSSYEQSNPGVQVDFEWRKRVPLKRGIPANIDVVVKEGNIIRFIESKFLEPYYSGNEVPRNSYLDATKYSSNTKDSPVSWVELFKKAKEFKYYNVTQLCRHLLAVSKELWRSPKQYQEREVHLQSICWEMPDSFMASLSDEERKEFIVRRGIIQEEAIRCERLLNGFINQHLQFCNLEFNAIKYNDLIGSVHLQHELREKLKKQYYL